MTETTRKTIRPEDLDQVAGGVPVPGQNRSLDADGSADALRDHATLPIPDQPGNET